jgi:two-component system chemotaxis response regulator CheY
MEENMKALIVDDASLARIMLRKLLEANGYNEIWEASNGEEAINLYEGIKPNLVTMDITMPGINGITAIKRIMALDPVANIIVCSALGEKSIVLEAIQAGAKHFIIKPYDADKVVNIIKAVSV